MRNKRFSEFFVSIFAVFVFAGVLSSNVLFGGSNIRGYISGKEALDRLVSGNERFASDKMQKLAYAKGRKELLNGQGPFAVIVSCSDSVAPPESIFDAGLGDLFVLRTAGNVLGRTDMGSLEYGVKELKCPLLVVMGHEKCDEVATTFDALESGEKIEGNMASVLEKIVPAIEGTERGSLSEPMYIEAAINTNIKNVIRGILEQSEVTKKLLISGKLDIVGGKYSLETGIFEIIVTPEQSMEMIKK